MRETATGENTTVPDHDHARQEVATLPNRSPAGSPHGIFSPLLHDRHAPRMPGCPGTPAAAGAFTGSAFCAYHAGRVLQCGQGRRTRTISVCGWLRKIHLWARSRRTAGSRSAVVGGAAYGQ